MLLLLSKIFTFWRHDPPELRCKEKYPPPPPPPPPQKDEGQKNRLVFYDHE